MNYSNEIYIKTGHTSGYIPNTFISNEEFEYIIIPNDQSSESSGEVRANLGMTNQRKDVLRDS